MAGQDRLLFTIKVAAVALLVVSASVVAVVALSSGYLSNFSLNPYSSATYNTTSYSPQQNYSLFVTADSCSVDLMPSQDNTLHATLEVSQSFFYRAFANIEVTERTGSFTFDMITPQWFGTSAHAYVYVPSSLWAHTLSVIVTNGELNVDSPNLVSNLVMQTTNGQVNLQGDQMNNVTMETTNGNGYIDVGSFSTIISSITNGGMDAHLKQPVSSGSMSMNTINGNVNLYVNPSSNLTITASTVNGAVSISGLVYTASLVTSKQFVGTVNGGGASITLSTVNGGVGIIGQ